jgi:hypothetical protein
MTGHPLTILISTCGWSVLPGARVIGQPEAIMIGEYGH